MQKSAYVGVFNYMHIEILRLFIHTKRIFYIILRPIFKLFENKYWFTKANNTDRDNVDIYFEWFQKQHCWTYFESLLLITCIPRWYFETINSMLIMLANRFMLFPWLTKDQRVTDYIILFCCCFRKLILLCSLFSNIIHFYSIICRFN